MKKSLLVFLSGGVCGAVVALGLARWFSSQDGPASMRMDGGKGGVKTGVPDTETQKAGEASDDTVERDLDGRVAGLRTWTDGRGAEPDTGELYQTLADWAARDPQAALAWVHDAKRLPQRLQLLGVPLAAIARNSPGEAAGWLRQHVDAEDRALVLDSTFQLLSLEAPRRALELAMAFPEREQPEDLGGALGALVSESPQEALEHFSRLTGSRRESSARWMLGAWARKDAAAALRWMEGQRDVADVSQVRWAFLEECAQSSPEICVEFFKKFPATGRDGDDSYALSTLLRRSPVHGEAALSLVPAVTAENALAMWVRGNFERSPEQAMELLNKWIPAENRSSAIREGFEAWLESDRRSAMKWLEATTQPELRVNLEAEVMAWQARRDPEAALAVLNGPRVTYPELRDVVAQALMGWAQRDVNAAAGWVLANPGLVSAEQASEMTAMFLTANEEAGADWLAKLPAGAARDAAVQTAAVHWAERFEPELAAQVAGTIRDPEKRMRAFFSVYNALRSSDAGTAEKWLAESKDFSEETKRSWRAIAGGR